MLAAGVLALAAAAAGAATLGVAVRSDDPRLTATRLDQGFPGHPGGTITAAVELALREHQFELDAAQRALRLQVVSAGDAAQAREAVRRLAADGAMAVIADWPADWLAAAAADTAVPLINAGEPVEALRAAACRPHLFHTYPAERMLADALAQALVSRRWQRVLLLHGPSARDAERTQVVTAALRRFNIKLVAQRPFRLSADPRERDLGNVRLLTTGVDYDVLWVVDSDGEFARSVPYRTVLPRPVVGDAGLTAGAWAARFERFGAPQVARRFARHAERGMTSHDWAAWIAGKAVVQAVLAESEPGPQSVLRRLATADFSVDGSKGVRLSRAAALRPPVRPAAVGAGAAAAVAGGVRGGLSQRVRRGHRRALRHLHPYDVYIAPGLIGMVLLFNGMQSAWRWSTTARWA
jgi:ABC transporter substrate binding protein (PQQ-dependent alcohol dehydrogenase system)